MKQVHAQGRRPSPEFHLCAMASRAQPICMGASMEDLMDEAESKQDAVLFALAGLGTCVAFV